MNTGDAARCQDGFSLMHLDEQGRYLNGPGRPDPTDASDAIATRIGFLERQRATFAWKCGGLDAAGPRAIASASPMIPGGLLNHLARFADDMSSEWLHGPAQPSPRNMADRAADHDWD